MVARLPSCGVGGAGTPGLGCLAVTVCPGQSLCVTSAVLGAVLSTLL